jgi:hypothetical protein
MIRRTLPQRGTLCEVFVDIAKLGADIAGIARDVGVVISLAPQRHVEIETFRHAVTRDARGEAASLIGASSMRSSFEVQHDARRP